MSITNAPSLKVVLAELVVKLAEAQSVAELIAAEYAENGTDSLALIDYGATLNSDLHDIKRLFDEADSRDLFTMGSDL